MTAIIKKELRAYFTSVIGYILLAGFVFFNGMYFSAINVAGLHPDYSYVLGYTATIFLIMIPILTMRLFAEEARQKTDQLLYTAPLRIGQIVMGKFLSALLFLAIAMLITALFPITLSFYGPLPYAKIISAMVGYFFLGAAFIAAGMFISVLTDNQIVAAFASFALIFILFNMYGLASVAHEFFDTRASIVFIGAIILGFSFMLYDATKNYIAAAIAACLSFAAVAVVFVYDRTLYDGVIFRFLGWFALMSRFESFYSGILNLSDIVYYASFAAGFVYLTVNVIEKRRWR